MPTNKFSSFVNAFVQQFNARIMTRANHSTFSAALNVDIQDDTCGIKMTRNGIQHVITIPIPYITNNTILICSNDVERATGLYYWKPKDKFMDYIDVIYEILLGYPVHIIPEHMLKAEYSAVKQIRFGYENDNLAMVIHRIQARINHIVHGLPIHETFFNSYIMNKRITIFDPEFDIITDPEEQLAYQIKKNEEYFGKGWSSLGLSDGSLANKNYMLTCDLRTLTPFGLKHHNPQRNLYSTLGMLGDEEPLIYSHTTAKLRELGLTRTGWNLFTVFVDIPDVWEDQLMVDISHKDKGITYDKRYICHGDIVVKEGQDLNYDDVLFVNNFGESKFFDIICDSAKVKKIENKESNVGGIPHMAKVITVEYERKLKDGTKLTNLAANKGIIRLKDLGYATDPATGEERKIDVIVSANAVLKRKNYTQILEALLNTVNDEQPVAVKDDVEITTDNIVKALTEKGYNADGTWECNTYAGKFNCVAGKVFWGVTHDADDTVWRNGVTTKKNGRGLRDSGLKFSTIEFRALNTRFGKNNAVEKEVLSHAQGHEDIGELLNTLRFRMGRVDCFLRRKSFQDIKPLRQKGGLMLSMEDISGSIADPYQNDKGFILKLPVEYQVVVDKDFEVLAEGYPCDVGATINDTPVYKKFVYDYIYVPHQNLRKCWKHDIGKYGLSDIGNALNTILVMAHNYVDDSSDASATTLLYRAIDSYFKIVSSKLSTKKGEISLHGMSVRYPNSIKGVAALSNTLAPNNIEIHRSMANDLGVNENDIVMVERFPCLGFMSLRPQKVKITDDPLAKFTIRVSGNSLGSLSLDFDGDVLFVAAFRTPEANFELLREFHTPNEDCYEQIQEFNNKMGHPKYKELCLEDYSIFAFGSLTSQTHAEIVGKLTGVKSNTGPVVALAYNLLRIMENSKLKDNQRLNCGIEVFMDKLANSVFKQKHGATSLHKIVTDAVCTADVKRLAEEGFDEEISQLVCDEIVAKAKEIGVEDLKAYHEKVLAGGGSKIVNRIVRANNPLYFASRAKLESCKLIVNTADFKEVDMPSRIFKRIMSSPLRIETEDKKALAQLKSEENRKYCAEIFEKLNAIAA